MEISIGRPWYNDWWIGASKQTFRYADDLILFAKSLAEMIQMVQMIEEELAAAGLRLNVSKTKLLTTDSSERVASACRNWKCLG